MQLFFYSLFSPHRSASSLDPALVLLLSPTLGACICSLKMFDKRFLIDEFSTFLTGTYEVCSSQPEDWFYLLWSLIAVRSLEMAQMLLRIAYSLPAELPFKTVLLIPTKVFSGYVTPWLAVCHEIWDSIFIIRRSTRAPRTSFVIQMRAGWPPFRPHIVWACSAAVSL